jgi:hypothetical protein
VGGTGFRGTAFDEPSAVTGSASSELAGGSGVGDVGGAGVLGAVTGGASSELAGGRGFDAVGAAGFAVGGAGFLGAAPNELRAIAGFLGLGLAGGGNAAAAADFGESETGFPGPVPFGPTASARWGRLGLASGSDGFAAVLVAGFAIITARFIRALRIGPTATVECACSAVACGGMLRAINLFKSLRLGCRSEAADGSGSTVVEIDEFESLACTLPSG